MIIYFFLLLFELGLKSCAVRREMVCSLLINVRESNENKWSHGAEIADYRRNEFSPSAHTTGPKWDCSFNFIFFSFCSLNSGVAAFSLCVGTKCCFFDRNICHCDYVNASLNPKPRLNCCSTGRNFCYAVVQLWYTAERLSVVEYIYHSKCFSFHLRSKKVPETWWGFGKRISFVKKKITCSNESRESGWKKKQQKAAAEEKT